LHPVIRGEAIGRLRQSKAWELVNCKVAEFWAKSVQSIRTIKDAIRGMESYYHYLEVNDFELAAEVILKKRNDEQNSDHPLGIIFFKLGILEPMILAIDRIKDMILSEYSLSYLYRILGNLHWTKGNIHQAIQYDEKAGNIAKKIGVRWLEIYSFEGIGFCKIELWDIESALEHFEKLTSLLKELNEQGSAFNHRRYEITAFFCLAFLHSCLNSEHSRKKALSLAINAYDFLMNTQVLSVWRKALGFLMLGMTYKNLGEVKSAQRNFYMSITLSENNHYPYIKSRALIGLAETHRLEQEFDLALLHHLEAAELLEKIGDKCGLAESYYQLALTHGAMDDVDKSIRNFREAVRLFTEMEAPKQVERVKRSMNGKT